MSAPRPELRCDLLTGQWVALSPRRAMRPMHYHVDSTAASSTGHADSLNPFAPGNESHTTPEVYAVRPQGGPENGPGWDLRVVTNLYPALESIADHPLHGDTALPHSAAEEALFHCLPGIGGHEVIIETPDLQQPLERLSLTQMQELLKAWRARLRHYAQDRRIAYSTLFRNHGALAGASLRHPHSQLVALPLVPPLVAEKVRLAVEHYRKTGRRLLADMALAERSGPRWVSGNGAFQLWCPYASMAPLEMLLAPHDEAQMRASFTQLTDDQLQPLAELLQEAVRRLAHVAGNADGAPAWNLLLETAPHGKVQLPAAHLHIPAGEIEHAYGWHFKLLPRLSRLGGFEFNTGIFINALTPETAAEQLRSA